MSAEPGMNDCNESPRVCAYALGALPADETMSIEAHLATCRSCRDELQTLRPVVEGFVAWPTDVLRPSPDLADRLAQRIAAAAGEDPPPRSSLPQWSEPDWEEVAPGILCKLLANDGERHRVSMLVHLEPGVAYPPHSHAGVEELHLLDGELWINERKLYPGDYNHAEAPTSDARVWTETGCTCVLITSTLDRLA